MENDDNTILSRIRYPDRSASVLYGYPRFPDRSYDKRQYKLVLGIATVARPPGVDYLSKVRTTFMQFFIINFFDLVLKYNYISLCLCRLFIS